MKWHPRGFGGQRTEPETIKRDSWKNLQILVIDAKDNRLTWPEQELVNQLGSRLYGPHRRGKP